jgi:hypothetical protein
VPISINVLSAIQSNTSFTSLCVRFDEVTFGSSVSVRYSEGPLHCKKYYTFEKPKVGIPQLQPLLVIGYWKLHHLLGDSKNCAAATAVIQKPRWLLRSDSKILHGYLKTHLGVSKTCNLEIQKTESAFQKTIVGSFETPQLQVEFPITRNGCSNGIPTFSVSKYQH